MATRIQKAVCLLGSLLIIYTGFAQEWKNWNAAGLRLGLTKKLEVSVNHLRSYTLSNSFANGFNQTSFNLDYDFSKHLSSKAGWMLTQFPSNNVSTSRYLLRTSYK